MLIALRTDDRPLRRWQRRLAAAAVATQALAFVLAFAGGLTPRPREPMFKVVQMLYLVCLVVGMAAVATLMLVALHPARRGDGLLVYFGLREQPRR